MTTDWNEIIQWLALVVIAHTLWTHDAVLHFHQKMLDIIKGWNKQLYDKGILDDREKKEDE